MKGLPEGKLFPPGKVTKLQVTKNKWWRRDQRPQPRSYSSYSLEVVSCVLGINAVSGYFHHRLLLPLNLLNQGISPWYGKGKALAFSSVDHRHWEHHSLGLLALIPVAHAQFLHESCLWLWTLLPWTDAMLFGQILCSNARFFLRKYYACQIFSCCVSDGKRYDYSWSSSW